MMALLVDPLPFIALLGALFVVAAVLVAWFWPEAEARLLGWLQRRRARREARHAQRPRLARRGGR